MTYQYDVISMCQVCHAFLTPWSRPHALIHVSLLHSFPRVSSGLSFFFVFTLCHYSFVFYGRNYTTVIMLHLLITFPFAYLFAYLLISLLIPIRSYFQNHQPFPAAATFPNTLPRYRLQIAWGRKRAWSRHTANATTCVQGSVPVRRDERPRLVHVWASCTGNLDGRQTGRRRDTGSGRVGGERVGAASCLGENQPLFMVCAWDC